MELMRRMNKEIRETTGNKGGQREIKGNKGKAGSEQNPSWIRSGSELDPSWIRAGSELDQGWIRAPELDPS